MRILHIIALLLLLTPVLAQQATMGDIFSGKLAPLTVAVQELGPEWLSVEMRTPQAMPEWFTSMVANEGGPNLRALQPSYYTKGQTVSIGDETYLLAYELPAMTIDPQAMREGAPPARITPETKLNLTLLHLRTAGSLLNLHPFDLKAEMARMDEQNKAEKARIKARDERIQQARKMASTNNLRQLITAAQMYTQDNEECMPGAATVWEDIKIEEEAILHPVTKERYTYNVTLSGVSLGDIAKPEEMAAFYEENPPWEDGSRLVAFVDGHVESVSAEQWPEVKRKSGIK